MMKPGLSIEWIKGIGIRLLVGLTKIVKKEWFNCRRTD